MITRAARNFGLLSLATLCAAWLARAYDADTYAIRVESNQVIVPVFVYHYGRMRELSDAELRCISAERDRFSAIRPAQAFIPKDCTDTFFRKLTATDFQLLEDDAQQTIQSVSFERFPIFDVRDSLGSHIEHSSEPTSRWSTSDISSYAVIPFYFYRLAYVPPGSQQGSCHRVKVVVNRPDSFVFARSQYCNVKNAPEDPLMGTEFGKRLEGFAASRKEGKLSTWLQAGFFYAGENRVHVNVALDFLWNSLKRKWSNGSLSATIGVMGLVYAQGDTTLVARFSDFACCSRDAPNFVSTNGPHRNAFPEEDELMIPTRYETQIYLSPGNYHLRVVLSDNSNFGLVTVPLKIEPVSANQLGISSVMLCKRFRNAAVAKEETAAANVAPRYVPLVSKGVQFTPAGDTRFRKGEPLIAYFEIYEPLRVGSAARTIQTELKITDTKTGEVKLETSRRSAADWIQPGKSAIPVAERIALDKLPPGSYRLDVLATDSAGRSTLWRSTNFIVE